MVESPELLDQLLILSRMDQHLREQLRDLKIEATLDSTNSAVQRLPLEEQHGTAIVAEQQRAGRGRYGKHWHSPVAANLYLSLGWKFEQTLAELVCLPLVVALSAAQAVRRAGLEGHGIKWPNDLLFDRQKFCGCLVEVQGDARGPCHTVVGVGINVHMPADAAAAEIDQPWTDLATHLADCSRNSLAAFLLEELIMQLTLFVSRGFEPFRDSWQQYDAIRGQTVDVMMGNQSLSGVASGIDDEGALLLDTGNAVLRLHSAEVSLKPRWDR